MTPNELIDRLYGRHSHRMLNSRDDIKNIISDMSDMITAELELGNKVRLENLGTLCVTERTMGDQLFGKPHPYAGQVRRQVTFRDSASLKRKLND